jgi:hypothetical protein
MVGQGGAFGRLVTITSRTYRRPAGAVLARFSPDPWWVNVLLPTACRPQWAMMKADALWCGYLGDERTLEFYRGALAEFGPGEITARSLEEDVDHRTSAWTDWGNDGSFRASVPPISVMEFVSAAGLDRWAADAAFGIVIGVADGRREAIEAAARAVGGGVYFVEGGRVSVRLEGGRRELLRRLKGAFDPDGKLEPLPER